MDKTSDLPMALWKANLDLQMRLGRLMQESGQHWLELGTRAAGESAAEFQTEATRLLQAGNWQALAALPMDAFWRQAEQRVGDGQASAQAALQAQEGFARGLTEALQEWQRDLAKAWAVAGIDAGAVPGIAGSWDTMLSNLEQGIAAMMPGGTGGSGARTRGG
ncbi:phasin family protein [Luteimonas sp. SDU82]|uniref:phasin family protein n=1 Tax=Luteimonas sp. SDU82 TaxID=3422592 RepID=UPI003EBB3E70